MEILAVHAATEVIERLAIDAALQLTNDDWALAAKMLGLSRQSPDLEMHGYGIGRLVVADPT